MYHKIIPNLYLGNRSSTEFSKSIGIDYIISIGSQSIEKNIENFHLGLRDDKTLDIITLLQNKAVLVHSIRLQGWNK